MVIESRIITSPVSNKIEHAAARIAQLKKELGSSVYILAHHYQRDEIVESADKTGDSLELARHAARNVSSKFIVFCGVYFMAETADILTTPSQKVCIPDRYAGCFLADMADKIQIEYCWDYLKCITKETIIPITYVNSSAEIKAFCGRNGGAVCTSANADKALAWAASQGGKVLFLPDQHLGRNTAFRIGIPLDKMALYDPNLSNGGETEETYANAHIILWQGYCSVHVQFNPYDADVLREKFPDINIIVHPECTFEVVQKADYAGSTSYIIKTIEEAKPGSKWAIGTEFNLVNRLKNRFTDKMIIPLSADPIYCATMYRIDAEHLLWTLESIKKGIALNQISVPEAVAAEAKIALERMFTLTG